jgi:hypothetical protein
MATKIRSNISAPPTVRVHYLQTSIQLTEICSPPNSPVRFPNDLQKLAAPGSFSSLAANQAPNNKARHTKRDEKGQVLNDD